MKKSALFGAVMLGILVCLSGAPAKAQGKVDVFAGYSYETNSVNVSGADTDPGLHGYNLAVTANLNRHIGLEANFAGHNGTSTIFSDPTETDVLRDDTYTYTFGPKITEPVGNFQIYTHFLVGVMQQHQGEIDTCTSSGTTSTCFTDSAHGSGFGFVTGGGLDWIRGHWGLRILEVDYVHGQPYFTGIASSSATAASAPADVSDFRLATGIIWRWGK